MKVGAENKKKAVGAVVLLVIAVFMVVRTIRTRGPEAIASPAAGVPVKPNAKPRGGPGHRYVAVSLAPTLDPRLRLDLLKDSEGIQYAGTGRNIFSDRLEDIPQPKGPGLMDKKSPLAAKPVWTPPPQALPPPINLKFYGWASQVGEPKAIFLSRGENVFVAHEGDIIDRRYKVVRITSNAVEIEDVLSNNKQSIPLTAG